MCSGALARRSTWCTLAAMLGWRSVGAWILATGSLGCSYHSSYVPPDDGHARVVWQGRQLTVVGPASGPQCPSVAPRQADRHASATSARRGPASPRTTAVAFGRELDPIAVRRRPVRRKPAPDLEGVRSQVRPPSPGEADEDDDALGGAMVAVAVVLAAFALTATSLVLATAPAGDATANAHALSQMQHLNRVQGRPARDCAPAPEDTP